MKYSEITQLSEQEIRDRIEVEEEALKKLRFAHAISPVENPLKIKFARKFIAQLKTRLRQVELEKAKA